MSVQDRIGWVLPPVTLWLWYRSYRFIVDRWSRDRLAPSGLEVIGSVWLAGIVWPVISVVLLIRWVRAGTREAPVAGLRSPGPGR